MDKKQIEQIIFETLEKCGVRVPVEAKFDYSGLEQPAKAMEFIRLTQGELSNAIYVSKIGGRDGDSQYFDLLFAVNEQGEPVCIPVPIARKLFNNLIDAFECKGTMSGRVYETIYRHYYQQSQLPF
jgi:hypothetical protein